MKKLLILFPCFISIASCAVSYNKISLEDDVATIQKDTANLAISIGVKTLLSNTRIASKANYNKYRAFELEIINKSDDTLILKENSVKLISDDDTSQVAGLDEFYEKVRFSRAGYWFYSLIWFGRTTYDSENGSSSIWIPVGFPISLINFSIASASNTQFKKDLTENYLKETQIVPKCFIKKMIVFKVTNNFKYNMQIELVNSNTKEIILQRIKL